MFVVWVGFWENCCILLCLMIVFFFFKGDIVIGIWWIMGNVLCCWGYFLGECDKYSLLVNDFVGFVLFLVGDVWFLCFVFVIFFWG